MPALRCGLRIAPSIVIAVGRRQRLLVAPWEGDAALNYQRISYIIMWSLAFRGWHACSSLTMLAARRGHVSRSSPSWGCDSLPRGIVTIHGAMRRQSL